MNITLQQISTTEILHYLGYSKGQPDEAMLAAIEHAKQRVLELSDARIVYKEFTLENGQPVGIDFHLAGEDIQRLWKESHHCIFMAVTLGVRIEQEIKRLQIKKDMGQALIFDSCASAAIEAVCDLAQAQMEELYKTKHWFLTDRYSCGYGDLPLTIQKDFIRCLDAQRKIGLYVTDSYTLHPRKSVTAIIGLADCVQPAILRGCGVCLLKDSCTYRKGGSTCGK